MYLLYSLLLTAGALLGFPYWILEGIRERKYFASFRQRLGFGLPETGARRPLWIHAVSVGEVLAARPLSAALTKMHPNLPLVVSTVTLTGQELARREIPQAQAVLYFPFDWAFAIRRFLRRLEPQAVVLLETELWPNFLRLCGKHSIPVFVANGRLSDRSRRRYRRAAWLARRMFSQLSVLGVQTHEDRRRFVELGAPEARVRVTGNLKFDFTPPDAAAGAEALDWIRRRLTVNGSDPVVVVGSTMRGEEPLFVKAFRELRPRVPGLRMVLAPRHPERFAEVAALIAEAGIAFCRRSESAGLQTQPAEVVLLDTIGELRAVYGLATVAVVAGSFLPFGGHNLLEPAALGKAIVFGPEMSNFAEMARLFLREQAARQCAADALPDALFELLTNARARELLGQRAASTFRQNQGATENTLAFLLPALGAAE